MSSTNGYKKVVHWVITDEQVGKEFEEFQKVSIFLGISPFLNLGKQLSKYVKHYKPESITLQTEAQFMEELEKRNLKVTRVTLNKWRQSDILKLNFHWYTDGHSIIYNMEESIEVIQMRHETTQA